MWGPVSAKLSAFGPSTLSGAVSHMNIPHPHDQNADQVAYWNGPAGQRWAERQAAQDVCSSRSPTS